MANTILVTGATGFLGSQIILKLLKNHDISIIALIRAQNQTAAIQRAHRAWWDFPALTAEIDRRIYIIAGDVSQSKFGLNEPDYQALIERTDYIIHGAADLRLNAPIAELRRTNVQGTANILTLATQIHSHHGLKRLAHISTAYVCGRRSGQISESSLDETAGFSNAYEFTKFEAEKLVQAAQSDLPISIFRPGMVVGDSATGYIKTFNTIYFPLKLYFQKKLKLVPASPDLKINLVPVDFVASSIAQLTFEEKAKGLTFHLTSPS
ncbi:SDR family oxidoreductase, partial [candidate division KSB1 bacterium]|nr:SDR family oxidoreductase [candidate division KSB1 bacterium]